MLLLEDIQAAAVDAKSDLSTLLRKCKLLAARLDNKQLENWILLESNGYPPEVDVPDYRIWPLELKGHFCGPFGSGIRNAPIPLVCIPEKARTHYQRYQCRQSIASIEAILKQSEGGSGTLQVSTGDLALALGGKVYLDQNCVQAWAEFSQGELVELLNAVRNRILDFAIALWKESPTAGEPASSSTRSLEPSKVTQIFNTTVYGGAANLVGTAHDSSITFDIVINDFASLARVLKEKGIADSDIKELQAAINSDPRPTEKERFGPKVSSWIAKMMKKAADGGWDIGISVAGTLLAQAIAKYYGL